MERPNAGAILSTLKDFQRASVDVVFNRLFGEESSHRYLLADEVGLGKTLVAKGVIAKAVEHLWDKVDRIDIIYICSNADIARQNIRRLNIYKDESFVYSTRITHLPLEVHNLKRQKVNFIAFTPGTSFELQSAAGTAHERALLYWMLRDEWDFRGVGAKNVLQGSVTTHRFRQRLDDFPVTSIDADIRKAFHVELERHRDRDVAAGSHPLRERFLALCDGFPRERQATRQERAEISGVIGELRSILAGTCIRALEPDLVVLDEFQRFKHLLTAEDEAGELARELFAYEGLDGKTRVLLLSATPYKMYTGAGDARDEDHYSDFLQTLGFLQHDALATDRTRIALEEYRRSLFAIDGGRGPLIEARGRIERELRRVMCRTERLASSEDRNGMLREMPGFGCGLSDADVRAYQGLQRLTTALEHADPTEYWKSTPYVLGLMDDYELKHAFKRALKEGSTKHLLKIVRDYPELSVPTAVLSGSGDLAHPHPRVRWLLRDTVDRGMWRLLWMPASLPYYLATPPFDEPGLQDITKRLIFSAWRVVPKAIGLLLSHEVERRLFLSEDSDRGVHETRDKLTAPLEFRRDGSRLTGLPLFSIVYPSRFLARVGDPLDSLHAVESRTLAEVRSNVVDRINGPLSGVTASWGNSTDPPDEAWYWAAPLLLDLVEDSAATREFFYDGNLPAMWAGLDGGADETSTGWAAHVEHWREFLRFPQRFGAPPPDLAEVLADQALGGPATIAFRALRRFGSEEAYTSARVQLAAAQVGWAFRGFFNLPEAVAAVRHAETRGIHWRDVLSYCAAGNLQAVMDEYFHVLREAEGLYSADVREIGARLAEVVRVALSVRTARVVVDDVSALGSSPHLTQHRLRVRFAMRFGHHQEESDTGERTPAAQTQAAFNSPFWPFVLATTSVGQEGLDFHQYCHAVVHWNLPSNPVDLEQREGRVHRYKGHAVRKNIARAHAGVARNDSDPWRAMFDAAASQRQPLTSEILPFWVYPGLAAIQRHVPAIPLSRDLERLGTLRRSLAAYRIVFGQPRQDEMLSYLMNRLPAEAVEDAVKQAAIDLSPGSGSV